MSSKFHICDNQGFQLTFENGWTISVQFGPPHYCSNRNLDRGPAQVMADILNPKPATSETAEVAIIRPDGEFEPFDRQDNVISPNCRSCDSLKGWVPANEVAQLIYETSQR